jgi:hypothetical protein
MRSLFSDIKIKDRSSAIGLRKTLKKPTTSGGCYGEMVCCSGLYKAVYYNSFLLLSVGPSCSSSIRQHGARA